MHYKENVSTKDCNINYQFNNINPKVLKEKLKVVLQNTINDLPFGDKISDKYKKALEIVAYYIMYYNKESTIATIPMVTGGGKSTALINAVAFMVNDPELYMYSGTTILKLEQKDADFTANAINAKAGRKVAYSFHSGLNAKGKLKNRISKKELAQYPVLVMCHEGFKTLIRDDKNDRILNWSDGIVSHTYSDYNKFQRRRLIIDEEISNTEIQTITLKSIALIENAIMNMGNRYLFSIFNNFIEEVKSVFVKPYQIKANSSLFISLDIKVPKKLDQYIYKEANKGTQQAYLTLRNFIKHGGYIQHADDINNKVITTYSYINLNIPIFYKTQLDATANINYLYDINNDFELVKLPSFKTYSNTYINIFYKITGSRSIIEHGFNHGLMESCIKDIKSKAKKDDKILIILNNKEFINKFTEAFYNNTDVSKVICGCEEDCGYEVDFTYYGAFKGKNDWSLYNKLFLIGIPIYTETTYPILYKANSKTEDFKDFNTTLAPMDGARRYLQQEFEKVRTSLIAREVIQGINRIRCRWFEDGDTPEAHVYTINKDKQIDYIIKKAMPEVKILYDWDLDYTSSYQQTEVEPAKEELLMNKIVKIQDNILYRESLKAKGILAERGIKKKDLRELVDINNRQTFSRIFSSPIFHQFCIDRNINIGNPRSHYIKI